MSPAGLVMVPGQGPVPLCRADGTASVLVGGSRIPELTPECSSFPNRISSVTAVQVRRLERTSTIS